MQSCVTAWCSRFLRGHGPTCCECVRSAVSAAVSQAGAPLERISSAPDPPVGAGGKSTAVVARALLGGSSRAAALAPTPLAPVDGGAGSAAAPLAPPAGSTGPGPGPGPPRAASGSSTTAAAAAAPVGLWSAAAAAPGPWPTVASQPTAPPSHRRKHCDHMEGNGRIRGT
jgi:hypothetical protein